MVKLYIAFQNPNIAGGVSILFRKGLPVEILNTHKSLDGRRLFVNIRYDDKDFSFVNVYAPNTAAERTDFFKRLSTWTNQLTCNKEKMVLAGDFNCLLDHDSTGDQSVHILKCVIQNLDLIDMWRNLNTEPGFTWCDGDDVPKSRIDYIFVTRDFAYIPCNMITRIVPGKHSNNTRMSVHRCLKFLFDTCGNLRGPGYWKFKTSLLQNKEFVDAMKTHLDNLIFVDLDPHQRWEENNASIKTFCINVFSKLNSKANKHIIADLQKRITKIEESKSEDIDMNLKRNLESELALLLDKKSKGAKIRSRANWIEQGKKNSSYF